MTDNRLIVIDLPITTRHFHREHRWTEPSPPYLSPMIKVALACSALALTLLTVPPAQAATAPKAGDCYAKADVDKDFLDTRSKVDCSQPHAVQVTYVGKLPGFLRNRAKVAVGGPKSAFYARYVKAGYGICTGGKTASGIWPSKGKAVAAALGKNNLGFVPSSNPPLGYGWVLPDQAAWDRGVRVLVCIAHQKPKPWTGNLQALETSNPLPDFRLCVDREGQFQSCGAPHSTEDLFYWEVTGFPKGEDISADQRAPYDARCQAAADVLIGAKRADLRAKASLIGRDNNTFIGKEVAGLSCYVERTDGADLPAGTVVGLGNRPLGS